MLTVSLKDIANSDEIGEAWWKALADATEQGFQDTAALLAETCHFKPEFDEVALMVQDAVHEYFLLEGAVRVGGWNLTNAAIDHVATSPIASSYSVHYSFLTRPDKPWRIEVMRITNGLSPLHIIGANEDLVNVHWSFKCKDEEWYAETVENMLERKWRMAQGCESTYGKFSYFLPPINVMAAGTYIKPRVNVRDAQNAGSDGAQA